MAFEKEECGTEEWKRDSVFAENISEMEQNMKKVLILANSSGGLYDFRNELVLELLKEYEVYVSVPDETAVDKLKAEGCKVIHTDINRRGMNPVQDLKLFQSYRKLLKEIMPQVVLTYTIKPNIYGGLCCRLQKVPYLVNITGLGTTFERGGMLQKMVVAMYRMALKKANCVFFQNDRNKQIFEENGIYGLKTKRVNGSGVNVEKFQYEEYPGREKPKFLFVGRLMKEKGIEEYLYCAKKYAKRAEFDIIGYCEEAYEEEVKKLQQQGCLRFHGFQSDVKSFYKDTDAVVIASYHEGMSNVLLEAAATGRPVLATNIPGCKEAVEDNMTGLLFAPRDTGALESTIEYFLSMQAKQREIMGQAARRKMEQEFDRRKVVESYMEEINCVI